tara:strand:+ start:82 stop:1335 length:1254 start_codon:yes stop_codon:yes gene_type:complete
MEKDTKVVYLHRKATDGTIFYVGMGNSERPYVTKQRNNWWNRTYKKHGITVCVVAKGLSVEDAYELEMLLISELGRKDKGLGSLVNLDSGGAGTSGYSRNKYLRKTVGDINSKKVINTETLEILKSGVYLNKKYGINTGKLYHDNPNIDWMTLEDYNKEKHLTEKWINRYNIKGSYLKLINTETLEVFYSMESACGFNINESGYKRFTDRLSGRTKNNSDIMHYEEYEKESHLKDEWKNRKKRTHIISQPRNHKDIEIYDFKEQVWFKTTSDDFKLKYKYTPHTGGSFCKGRFCRKECTVFDKINNKWKNIIDLHTGNIKRFNQWHLSNHLKVSTGILNSFFSSKQIILYNRYMLLDSKINQKRYILQKVLDTKTGLIEKHNSITLAKKIGKRPKDLWNLMNGFTKSYMEKRYVLVD